MIRHAYAKINLALSVGPPIPAGERDGGMHPISSWMHAIDLYDEVLIEHRTGESRGISRRPARESEIHIDWAEDAPVPSEMDWARDQDLAVRALHVMEGHIGEPLPVILRVRKRIPVGGGLAGGSSDAASVMLGVNELFGLGIPPRDLARLGRAIGADLAFFFDEGEAPSPALAAHIGEVASRVPRRSGELLLVLPPFGCPTPEVYRAYDALGPRPLRDAVVRALAAADPIEPRDLFNDLEPAAERVRPALAALRARLAAALRTCGGAPVHMSGSGSTLFVFDDGSGNIEAALRAAAPEAVVLRTRLV